MSNFDSLGMPRDAAGKSGRDGLCDHPDCTAAGLYRAPKSPQRLNEYYRFCLDHVREYNRAWDYCAGWNADDIEAETRRALCWDRPTWRLGHWTTGTARSARRATDGVNVEFDDVFGIFSEKAPEERQRSRQVPAKPRASAAERKALHTLGLDAEADWPAIKACYKRLAKRFHPDTNGGDRQAEERLKEVNLAYSVLKGRAKN
jgi:DnaJ-like protein